MPPKIDSNGGGGDAEEHVFRPAQKAKNAAPVAAKTANGVLERIPADRKDVVSYLLPFSLVLPPLLPLSARPRYDGAEEQQTGVPRPRKLQHHRLLCGSTRIQAESALTLSKQLAMPPPTPLCLSSPRLTVATGPPSLCSSLPFHPRAHRKFCLAHTPYWK